MMILTNGTMLLNLDVQSQSFQHYRVAVCCFMIFEDSYNLLRAARQAGVVGWFFMISCALMCELLQFNHQLFFTLGWLKSSAAVFRWQLLNLKLEQIFCSEDNIGRLQEETLSGKHSKQYISRLCWSPAPESTLWLWIDKPWALFVNCGLFALQLTESFIFTVFYFELSYIPHRCFSFNVFEDFCWLISAAFSEGYYLKAPIVRPSWIPPASVLPQPLQPFFPLMCWDWISRLASRPLVFQLVFVGSVLEPSGWK